jgi:hypothetical protein
MLYIYARDIEDPFTKLNGSQKLNSTIEIRKPVLREAQPPA